jgi:dTDP-4-amino-4,6-dideoxygalactose transaminase
MIPLSSAYQPDTSIRYVKDVLDSGQLAGRGPYTKRCEQWLEEMMPAGKAFLTTSGTQALEMAAMVANIQPADEVIFPSYTFVATVNAFVSRGAVPVFVDIERDTMNIDARQIEAAISDKTKAIVPVHYAGIPCDMATIMSLATRHDLMVIEDAAQGLTSTYKGAPLGTIGHIGCVSFHDTKNFTSGGQGGAVLVNRNPLVSRAEIVHDNGTNRLQFMRGLVSQYSWQDKGTNCIMSEVLASLLWSHLESSREICKIRLQLWNNYKDKLDPIASKTGAFIVPGVPEDCEQNAHIFYIKIVNPDQRSHFISHMKAHGVAVAPHYTPLHSSTMGQSIGRFVGLDNYTTLASSQLVRLPLYHELNADNQEAVIVAVTAFFQPPNFLPLLMSNQNGNGSHC